MRSLEEKHVKLRENAASCGRPVPRLEDKRAMLKLTFAERLVYRKTAVLERY